MNFKQKVGAAIKAARVKKGLTMKEFADVLGVSGTTTVSRYESGNLNLSSDLIDKICKALEVNPDIILTDISNRTLN